MTIYFCSSCNKPISNSSRSGKCKSCARRDHKHQNILGRTCSICGVPIGDFCKYDLCHTHMRRRYGVMRRAKSWRKQTNRLTRGMVECHMPGCHRQFYLESWQHPQMAYCPQCRKREEYVGYGARLGVITSSRPSLTPSRIGASHD